MIHLFVTFKGRVLSRYDLDADQVRVGRHPDNDIQIESMAVSRYHCLLRRDARTGGWSVEDLGSPNGTFLNGNRVEGSAPIRSGDALSVGQFQVSVRTDVAPDASIADGGQAPELLEAAAAARGFLELLDRPGPPVLLERDVLQLGADPGADLTTGGPRKRALLVRGYGGFQLVNVGPDEAGVRVDGHPVADRVWLADGAKVAVEDLSFVFRVGTPLESESTIQMRISDLDLPQPPWSTRAPEKG